MTRGRIAALAAAALAVAAAAWFATRGRSPVPAAPSAGAGAPPATRGAMFTARSIGEPIRGEERPQIANVAVADLDRDGLGDVIVCDALRGTVSWIRQSPRGTFAEQRLADVPAAAHVEPVDFDGDGDLDLLTASLGALFPNNNRIGSVIVLENDGQQRFRSRYIADRIARVSDARAGDLDGDGDLDVAVAGFGYDDGETSWLENMGGWRFEQHVLQRLSGGINSEIADINGDNTPDIVVLVSQEWEEIWAFLNDGRGRFTPHMLWGSTNPDFGSSWLTLDDMDRDGDPDVLYSNGDAFEYAPANSRPWQGVQWLENVGGGRFEFHRIADLQGATSPVPIDADADGDTDVMLVTANNDWDNPAAASLLWLENTGNMQFRMQGLATAPTHLQTLDAGDLDGDGRADLASGGMHISRPYDRMARVTAWLSGGGASR